MVKRICGIFVLGLTSSFFWMSSGLPASVTEPVVEYLTTFGLVDITKLKFSVIWFATFFCSSSFALTSKKSSSVEEYWPVRSPCKLSRLMETVTPETEYCGFTADSSLYIIQLFYYLTFVCG